VTLPLLFIRENQMYSKNITKIDENTFLIDFELFGIRRAGAVYLLKANKSCLIDSGTHTEAKLIINALDSLGAFPPDMIILTHSHFDHSQGTPVLCREAEKRNKKITVMASEKGVSNLRDQSWNKVLVEKHHKFEGIPNVTPLRDGQTVDLNGLELKIMDFAGHCADDIAIYNERDKTVFVGDAVGYKIEHAVGFPPFMPPFWNPDGFKSAVNKLKYMDCQRICLAHFGCLADDEARNFPDEAMKTYETWWNVFVEADKQGKLDDVKYLKETLIREAKLVIPDLELTKKSMQMMLGGINLLRKIFGKKPIKAAEVQLGTIAGWLAKGYRTYNTGV
jgi:glyoxylase-like metal-dependent hydrolase (beta-lactamase superfamily II)